MNWLTSSENGRWTSIHEGLSGGVTVTLGFMLIVFFGIMTTGLGQVSGDVQLNVIVESLSALGVGLFYMVIVLTFLAGWWIESEKPETRILAVIDLGPVRTWIFYIPLGLAFGTLFIFLLDQFLGSFFPFETLEIFGVNIEPFLLIVAPVFAIPIAEELFFGGVLTPTLTEALGVVATILLVGIIWLLWHLGTYSASPKILLALFVFRAVSTVVILYTESLMIPISAHIVVNFAGTFFTIG